jgi:hypothetical protein
MSAPATPPAPTSPTGPSPADAGIPSRAGRLLQLVHSLIDYAKELASTIHQRIQTDPYFGIASFGTNDIATILATISRGLGLAKALEARLLARPDHLAPEWRAARAPSPRKPPAALPAARDEPADTRIANLPTPAQIAEQVRRRPIGAVIGDICRDLGIMPSDPLWREIQHAVMLYGGSLVRLFSEMSVRRHRRPLPGAPHGTAAILQRRGFAAPAITGPP